MNNFTKIKNILLLTLIAGCSYGYKADVTIDIDRSIGYLNVVEDSLYFVRSSNVFDNNLLNTLAEHMKEDGFNISANDRDANVKVYVSKNKQFVNDIAYANQSTEETSTTWQYNNETGHMDPVITETDRDVMVPFTTIKSLIEVRVVFVRDGQAFIDASIIGKENQFYNNYKEYIRSIFNLIKEGNKLRKAKIIVPVEKSVTELMGIVIKKSV